MELYELGRRAGQRKLMGAKCSGRRAAYFVNEALQQIQETKAVLEKRSWKPVPTAVEWILDNTYLALREGRGAEEELRRGKRLRRCGRNTYLQLAAADLVLTDPTPGKDELHAFLSGVQEEQPLTEEELSLFLPAIQGALCCVLAGLCREVEADPNKEGIAERLGEIFCGLRNLSGANLGSTLEGVSIVEQILQQDPSGQYKEMSEETRAAYRYQVCQLARKNGLSERETAERVLRLAKERTGRGAHIGWFIFREPLGKKKKHSSGALYVAAIILPTFFLALWLGFSLHSLTLFFLLLLPASDLSKNLIDFLMVRMVPPRPIHSMEIEKGIPVEGKTLCAIAGLITGTESGATYAALLERYRLANRDSGENLRFGLLADLPDRNSPMGPQELQWVRQAAKAIEALNEKYEDDCFYLFFRQPCFQKRDECYVGWERKRGALLELVRLLKGKSTNLKVYAGDHAALMGVRYVITLDSDTGLNVGAARKLVGAMLHPLNSPQIDPKKQIVVEGYGLLQPRIGVDLKAANRSRFSRIFAGQGGIDPYGGACSDVYHDLFDRGSYTGKGIFDVDAFYQCLDGRFPKDRILSHDLIEGAYLHAGLLENVELTDGYPYRVNSYFSRMHRWVRGDWQLLPWLGRWVKNEAGKRVLNPIPSVDKWKIFDNLRRSLSPVSTLIALFLGMCISGPALGVAGGLAIVSIWSNLLLAGADLAFHGGTGVRRRYHGTVIAGFGGMVLQTLVQLLFLPYQAWICGSAALTALWRSVVSHRHMLEWVTTADAERKGGRLGENFRSQWPAVTIGCLAMYFAQLPAGAAIGLVWAVSPVFAWALSEPMRLGNDAAETDRSFLLHQAALIWGYFRDWLRQEDHWLPPDNVQEKPWLGPARRTSPTNIGMALLSCIAAVDLELTEKSQAIEIICHMLDSIEALPKWNGHLYNWYDTSSCEPLHPKYVSTVDSGNLRGCLITLREALYQWGEGSLASRAEMLSDHMDLSPLYDKERRLFSIGYDAEKGELTAGWYDLLASEARLSSYMAVSLGEVDPKHWARLGRGLLGENNYCGLASWTGTMFEYFMPNLFLPCEEGSMMYESLAFCIYAQKRRAGKAGTPWGISESGFYAFDPGMAYQYKAHGVQSLGLRRNLNQELVVAPYASFLALLLAPRSAGRNLRRLCDMGLEGIYGLYEAADFTPGRIPAGTVMEPVRSFMAHHLGMSLLAIDNALNHNIMQERFLRDCAMGAFRELLQEKIPVGAPIMKIAQQNGPDRLRPSRQREFYWEGKGYCAEHPVCHLLFNGLLSALCTDAGIVKLRMHNGELPVLTCFGERYEPSGLSFFYQDGHGNLYPLTAAPFYQEGDFGWSFTCSKCEWNAKGNGFMAKITLSLPQGERGAIWTVEVEHDDAGELTCYLEPMLAKEADYFAHPAYSKLFLESRILERGVAFSRRPKVGMEREAMAICWDQQEEDLDTSRETALGRGGLRRIEQGLEDRLKGNEGVVLDPCLLVRFPLHGHGKSQLKLALGIEHGEEQAIKTAAALLMPQRRADSTIVGSISKLQLSETEVGRIMELLSKLVFPIQRKKDNPQSALWAYGISGDLPIAVIESLRDSSPVDEFPLKAHAFLERAGISFDLVYLLRDGGNYLQPQKGALLAAMKSLEMENKLGKNGGVHFVECLKQTENSLWEDWASVFICSDGTWKSCAAKPIQPPIMPCKVLHRKTEWTYGGENEIILNLTGELPPVGWNHFLVNPRFGWITDETGCGHLWLENARECQMTPWNNDPLAIGGPEWFLLTVNDETHSIYADGDGLPTTVTYGFGWASWSKTWGGAAVKTTAVVPWDREVRLLLIEVAGRAQLRHITKGKEDGCYNVYGEICLSTGIDGTEVISPQEFENILRKTKLVWAGHCQTLMISTPNENLNHYLNGWCIYQVIACRLLGRTSRYQNGGAYGFRDQLQDTLAVLPIEPHWARDQILRCCAHQFREGDVQHWWHQVGAEKNRGVRTRISDDLLWLPYTLSRYVETWGDDGFLHERAPWLNGTPLAENEAERYFVPENTEETADIYTHALQAIHCALERGVGEHGLLKMGTGDWNDGMNQVGIKGKGESVWLTWFAIAVLEKFVPLAHEYGDQEAKQMCLEWAKRLRQAAEAAWDGEWYLRGWYDNGKPLGSRGSEECSLDSVAQSWAVLADGDPTKRNIAITSALERLFDRRTDIVKIFDPPFDHGTQEPGYIKGYLPGIRENGGQYTHAATWLALACFQEGRCDEGLELLTALLPAEHLQEVYKAEPYVLAGDVYSHPDHAGRGGWSWYTGAAGWFYQTAVRGLLGLNVQHGSICLAPGMPTAWSGWSARWQIGKSVLQIKVSRGITRQLLLDGSPVEKVELSSLQGEHALELTL